MSLGPGERRCVRCNARDNTVGTIRVSEFIQGPDELWYCCEDHRQRGPWQATYDDSRETSRDIKYRRSIEYAHAAMKVHELVDWYKDPQVQATLEQIAEELRKNAKQWEES